MGKASNTLGCDLVSRQMSVCNEGWGEYDKGRRKRCPCNDTVIAACRLTLWTDKNYYNTEYCPFAPAIHTIVDNPDFVLVAVPDCTDYVDAVCIEHYEDIGNNPESAGRYWIKGDHGA